MKGATTYDKNTGDFKPDFNPRPREGSDETESGDKIDNKISIHAPVKGATIC